MPSTEENVPIATGYNISIVHCPWQINTFNILCPLKTHFQTSTTVLFVIMCRLCITDIALIHIDTLTFDQYCAALINIDVYSLNTTCVLAMTLASVIHISRTASWLFGGPTLLVEVGVCTLNSQHTPAVAVVLAIPSPVWTSCFALH